MNWDIKFYPNRKRKIQERVVHQYGRSIQVSMLLMDGVQINCIHISFIEISFIEDIMICIHFLCIKLNIFNMDMYYLTFMVIKTHYLTSLYQIL
jgi:hypothetical protein